ncbi:MAG TPA: hypothetical protein VFV08_00390 [Puia sp.]|nr:hypothetical protein [Puia sp.]
MQTEFRTKQNHFVKQEANQSTKVKFICYSILGMFLLLQMSSCTKNAVEAPGQNKIQESTLNKSATPNTNNSLMEVPFEDTLFVPCANSGAGERVVISGNMHYVYQLAWNDQGFHLVYHENTRQVIGIGLTSGDRFVASDGMQGTVTASWVNQRWIGTTDSHLRLVGKNANYSVDYKDRLVVTPDGKVVVDITDVTIDCK